MKRIIGHRGWASKAPENTIHGFKLALEDERVWAIECDVHLTKDKKIVVAFQINKALFVRDIASKKAIIPRVEHFQMYEPIFEEGVNTNAHIVFEEEFICFHSIFNWTITIHFLLFSFLFLKFKLNNSFNF